MNRRDWPGTQEAFMTGLLDDAGLGLAAGAVLSFGAARGLSSLLYGVDAVNPTTFALAGGAVLRLTLLCAWIPVRRAVAVDPMVTLREE